MDNTLVDLLPWFTGLAAFGLIASIWLGVVFLWYRNRAAAVERVQERLGLRRDSESGPSANQELWQQEGAPLRSRMGKLKRLTLELGWDVPPYFLVLGPLGASVGGSVFMLAVTGDWLMAGGAGMLLLIGPWMYINNTAKKRKDLFDNQLAASLGLAARSLRAGHPLAGSFRLIVEEMEDPISSVFDEILQQQDLGMSAEDSLRATAERSSSEDLVLVAASIVIQVRSGGNLADTMQRLEEVIRDRMRLMRRTRSLTAQATLSKRVLLAMPVLTVVLMQLFNPAYMEPIFTTNLGRLMLAAGGVMLFIGSLVMDKLSTLKY